MGELAKYTGVSRKTLNRHLKELHQEGIITTQGNNLILFGQTKLNEIFGFGDQPYYFKHYFNTTYKVKDIKRIIRATIIKESFFKQNHTIKNSKSIPSNEVKKTRCSEFVSNYKNLNKVQLSQFGFAKKMGLKHSSSGLYHLRQLKKYGFLTYEKVDPVFISKGGKHAILALRELFPTYSFFVDGNGNIFRNSVNNISLINF